MAETYFVPVPWISPIVNWTLTDIPYRSGTQEFLAQQLQTISVVKMENPKHKKTIQGSLNRYSRWLGSSALSAVNSINKTSRSSAGRKPREQRFSISISWSDRPVERNEGWATGLLRGRLEVEMLENLLVELYNLLLLLRHESHEICSPWF